MSGEGPVLPVFYLFCGPLGTIIKISQFILVPDITLSTIAA